MNRSIINPPHGRILQVAMSQYGLSEWTGVEHNPEVMKYFHDLGHDHVKDDETAWCAAFVNWVIWAAGFIGTNTLDARSFLKIGKDIPLDQAQSGDVIVLWRDNPRSWKGHVGFLVHYDDHFIHLLSGNQGNQVNIAKYPIDRLLGVRRLTEDPFMEPEITNLNSKQRVYASITKERDYQDTGRLENFTDPDINNDRRIDSEKTPSDWIGYMGFALGIAGEAMYRLDINKAMEYIRKATALGVAAMEFNKYPER